MIRAVLLSFILSSSVYALDCSKYLDTIKRVFSTQDQIPKIERIFLDLKKSTELSEISKKELIKLSEETTTKKILFDIPLFNIELVVRNLNNNKHFYQSYGQLSQKRILIDLINPGYARSSFIRARDWIKRGKDYKWKVPNFLIATKPSSIDKKFRKVFVKVHQLFNDEKIVFKRMQEFEDEILFRSYLEDSNFKKLTPEQQANIKQAKMVEILNELEIKHGFSSSQKGSYAALELENKSYSLQEWNEMLREGKIFNDTNFKLNYESAAEINEYDRSGHGYFTHRIQFHVLMKEIDANPNYYENLKGSDLFKKMGDMKFNKKMGLGRNEEYNLWQKLFDVTDNQSYHRPEFFRKMHELYPEIGAWF